MDHVEVPLADGDVDGLADRAATVVEVRRLVRQLDEVLEVLDRRVATTVVEVECERRTVVGREDRGVAADLHAAGRVAAVLDVLARRRRLHDLTAHATREVHAGPVDVGARVGEHLQRGWVVADLDTHLVEDRLGVALDDLEALVADDLERLHRSRQVGLGLDDDVRRAVACRPAPSSASPARAGVVIGRRQ